GMGIVEPRVDDGHEHSAPSRGLPRGLGADLLEPPLVAIRLAPRTRARIVGVVRGCVPGADLVGLGVLDLREEAKSGPERLRVAPGLEVQDPPERAARAHEHSTGALRTKACEHGVEHGRSRSAQAIAAALHERFDESIAPQLDQELAFLEGALSVRTRSRA